MKREVAKKWVKALRSKQYKKTTSFLKTVKGRQSRFCVLGVLCDLYQKNHKKKIKETRIRLSDDYRRQGWDGIIFEEQDIKYRPFWGRLPKEVMRWSGVKNSFGKFFVPKRLPEDGKSVSMVWICEASKNGSPIWLESLNDRFGASFKSLAEIIEDFYEFI